MFANDDKEKARDREPFPSITILNLILIYFQKQTLGGLDFGHIDAKHLVFRNSRVNLTTPGLNTTFDISALNPSFFEDSKCLG